MATRLSCSQCPSGSYVRTTEGPNDYKCELCDHELMYSDIADHLDEGDHLVYDDDGYVAYESYDWTYVDYPEYDAQTDFYESTGRMMFPNEY